MSVATVGTTTMTGVVLLKATDNNPCIEQQRRRPLSIREAHFRAMVENAKQSTWRENLEIAAMAQEQNMGQGDRRVISSFWEKIDYKSQQILRRDREFWQQKKESQDKEMIFATTTIW